MEYKIIDYPCENCGGTKSYLRNTEYIEFGECTTCGDMTFHKVIKDNPNDPPVVKCPYCGSVCTTKISKVSKAGTVMLYGVFGLGKLSKEWHCNNCNSDF